MGFWDEYREVGGNFIKAEEKAVLMEEGVPLKVVSVIDDEGNRFGPRYVVKVIVPDAETGDPEGEERAIGFPKGTVDSRDRMLSQLEGYLGREDADEVIVKLEKVGRSILIRKA